MAQIRYDAYQFANEAEMIAVIEGEGYNLETPIQMDSIITNNEDDTISSDVFCVSARVGNFKIPSQFKVKGQLRRYYWENIARYSGEVTP